MKNGESVLDSIRKSKQSTSKKNKLDLNISGFSNLSGFTT